MKTEIDKKKIGWDFVFVQFKRNNIIRLFILDRNSREIRLDIKNVFLLFYSFSQCIKHKPSLNQL